MKPSIYRQSLLFAAAPLALLCLGAANLYAETAISLSLDGAAEVPPVTTTASATGRISVRDDHMVKGSIDVSAILPTAAHIHEAATGANGPPIITLEKKDDNTFNIPDDTKLTEAQYQSFLAGNLYVNVHSDQYPQGEIRAQLTAAR